MTSLHPTTTLRTVLATGHAASPGVDVVLMWMIKLLQLSVNDKLA